MTANWSHISDGDTRAFRRALGSFMTGVTVVSTRQSDGECRAFTANSFTSVSLEPALVLVCLLKSSQSLDQFSQATSFSISILSEDQRELSNSFASRDPDIKAVATSSLSNGSVPFVPGSLCVLSCVPHQVVDAGDHIILIGRVEQYLSDEGTPLGYFRGNYVGIGSDVREIEKLREPLVVAGILHNGGKVLLRRKKGASHWEIPTAPVTQGTRHSFALNAMFSSMGLNIDITVPYSLFQEDNEHSTTFAFTVEPKEEAQAITSIENLDIAWFGPEDSPWEKIEGTMKKEMLKRFFKELESGEFGVYFDTLEGGSVLAIDGRPHKWDTWGTPKSPDKQSK